MQAAQVAIDFLWDARDDIPWSILSTVREVAKLAESKGFPLSPPPPPDRVLALISVRFLRLDPFQDSVRSKGKWQRPFSFFASCAPSWCE